MAFVVAFVAAFVAAVIVAVVAVVVVAEAEAEGHLSKTILLHQAYFLVFELSPAISLLQDLSLAHVASSSLAWVYSQELRAVEW